MNGAYAYSNAVEFAIESIGAVGSDLSYCGNCGAQYSYVVGTVAPLTSLVLRHNGETLIAPIDTESDLLPFSLSEPPSS